MIELFLLSPLRLYEVVIKETQGQLQYYTALGMEIHILMSFLAVIISGQK
jgi:hypothetical protein